jgi:hypothetical protein
LSIVEILSFSAIFLLVNLALFRTLPMRALSASQMRVADVAKLLFGIRGKQFILMVSLITAVSDQRNCPKFTEDSFRHGARRLRAALGDLCEPRRARRQSRYSLEP